MKRLIHKTEDWFVEIIRLIFFFIPTLFDGICNRFPYRKRKSGIISVLANGPSLKETLKLISTDEEFEVSEFSVMNDFATTDIFKVIKPKYYCLVDPKYVFSSFNDSVVHKTFETLNEIVDWKMNLYIPAYYKKDRFVQFSGIKNPNINIRVLCSVPYRGKSQRIINWLFRHGFTCPRSTVAQTCIYVAINSGFDEIRLYGFDHSFINYLSVDSQNRLCWRNEHFYENKTETEIKPMLHNDTGKQYKISDYFYDKGYLFKNHDYLASYARFVGCRVINKTKVSMVDSFDRV